MIVERRGRLVAELYRTGHDVPIDVHYGLGTPFAPDVQSRLKQSVPVQRIGTPEDIAVAVEFFASQAASYVTGQTLYVCGGRSLSSPSV